METILWIGISQSIFVGLLIYTKKNKSASDQILTVWLFLLATYFLLCGIESEIYQYPLLTNSFLLINPAFYLYVRSLIQKGFRLKWRYLFHLLPFILLQTVIYIQEAPFLFNSVSNMESNAVFSILFIFATFASLLFYNVASVRIVHRYRKNLKNEFSNIQQNNSLKWVLFILIFYIQLCSTVISFGVYVVFAKEQFIIIYHTTNAILLLLVYILGFYGLRQTRIFVSANLENDAGKYKNSLLTQKKKNDIKESIIQYFKSAKPYLDSDFNMDKLSQALNTPKHILTEVLNTELANNFFSFVNTYRVNDVKKILSSDASDLYSIEYIGYDCGFSSKSSFFTVFKKQTGKTPLQYKNSTT